MNKVVTINLNGSAFQLEEAAYDTLRAYLDNAARQLAANPDKDEIVADIEQAIGDKCRAVLSPHKNVVLAREITEIIAQMGPVDDGSTPPEPNPAAAASAGTGATSASSASGPAPARRLYRIYEGALVSGVCNGLAAYVGIDVALIRVIFVLLCFVTLGGMLLAYLVLVILMPTARTPDEKAAAQGTPSTAQEFIRRAREGYYQAARTWGDKQAHREWKRKFRQEMRAWKFQFRYGNRPPPFAPEGPAGAPPAAAAPLPPHPDWPLWIGAPFVGLIKAALTLLAILAVASLIMSGRLFTFSLPAGVPVWLAIVVVIVVYQIAAAPFHALRYAYRHGGWYQPHPLAAFLSVFTSILGLLLLVFLFWYVDRHVPEAHAFFRKIPPALSALFEALRSWWAGL